MCGKMPQHCAIHITTAMEHEHCCKRLSNAARVMLACFAACDMTYNVFAVSSSLRPGG